MTVSLKHAFTSNVADSPDATLVQPSNWNAEHNLTANTSSFLGTTANSTSVVEIAYTNAGLDLLQDADAATQRATLGVGTSDSPEFAGVNIGNASDTTITRVSAGVLAVEGNQIPSPGSVAQGDVLYYNGTVWARLAAGTSGQFLKTNGAAANPAWADSTGGATGGGTDQIFWENDQTVTNDYTITAGKNAGSFGPISINSGVTVTVPSGSVWTIV